MTDEAVTVVTVTRRRPQNLAEAIETVAEQCCVTFWCTDPCRRVYGNLANSWGDAAPIACVAQVRTTRSSGRHWTASARATPRYRLSLTDTAWVAFLDDDNKWRSNHLHSLLSCAHRSGVPAVHSWQRVVTANGEPFLERRDPWASSIRDARRSYDVLCVSA